jgi:N-acetyl-anhydromuramyl-L-alanine amidase AmpD
MLEVALWTPGRPPVHDVLGLLKRAGVGDDEIAPFKKSEVADLFPWLYYGKRLDVLRRVCNTAKTRIDSKLERKKLLVYCHLSMDDAGRIVASNL